MDASSVFAQYQELCNSNPGFIQCHTSKNSTLEWFGRTIRGRQKIQYFISNEIRLQYVHDFKTAHECDPIETEPSHMQTKEFIIDEEELQLQEKNVTNNNITTDELTPPQEKRLPELPKLTQGRSFLSSSNDDGEFDSDSNMREVNSTPPPSDIKMVNFEEPRKKKFRYSDPDPISYSPLPNVNDYFRKKTKNVNSANSNNRSSCSVTRNNRGSTTESTINGQTSRNCSVHGYSKLMYLESRGFIRTVNKPKHRGVSGIDYSIDVPRPSLWEREAIIKLSYRIRLQDNNIQFFLIIYEHLERIPKSRRNLLLEFKNLDSKDESDQTITKKHLQKEIKKKIPTLKKNLRFF